MDKQQIIKIMSYELNKSNSLNNNYSNILPLKIFKLKFLKNHYIKLLYYYSQLQKEYTIKDIIEEIKNLIDIIGQLSQNDIIAAYELIAIDYSLDNNENIIKQQQIKNAIKTNIELINKAIKKYYYDLNHKVKPYIYRICQYDINQLTEHNHLTNNTKKLLKYYLHYRLKHNPDILRYPISNLLIQQEKNLLNKII